MFRPRPGRPLRAAACVVGVADPAVLPAGFVVPRPAAAAFPGGPQALRGPGGVCAIAVTPPFTVSLAIALPVLVAALAGLGSGCLQPSRQHHHHGANIACGSRWQAAAWRHDLRSPGASVAVALMTSGLHLRAKCHVAAYRLADNRARDTAHGDAGSGLGCPFGRAEAAQDRRGAGEQCLNEETDSQGVNRRDRRSNELVEPWNHRRTDPLTARGAQGGVASVTRRAED